MDIDFNALKIYINGFNTIVVDSIEERRELFKILVEKCGFKIGFDQNGYTSYFYVSLGRGDKKRIHCACGKPIYENNEVIRFSDLESAFPDEDYSDELLASLPDVMELLN